MEQITIKQVSPMELVQLINEGITKQLQDFTSKVQTRVANDGKPHLTKKETAKFFDVSINCISDWSKKGILKPYRVGQRVYYSKEECIRVLFNQSKTV